MTNYSEEICMIARAQWYDERKKCVIVYQTKKQKSMKKFELS